MSETKQSFNERTQQIQEHYDKIATNYNESWNHFQKFIDFFANRIIEKLDLKKSDILVDLGCGTGIFTKKISDLSQLTEPIFCVDLSSKMLAQISETPDLKPIEMDAIEFTARPEKYNKVLMQYMIHHIQNKEKLLLNLFNRLNSEGRILIIRFAREMDHPVFLAAKNRYEQEYKSSNELIDKMKEIGFQVTVDVVDYPMAVEKAKYLKMVEQRYLSILSSFSDLEIKEGIKEIEKRAARQAILNFPEHILFIVGQKP